MPRAIAKKYNVVPVKLVKDELFVAMSDPLNFVAQEEIKAASHKRVVPMISTRRATEQAIGTLYGSEGTARAIEEMKREVGTSTPDIVPVQMNQTDAGNASAAPTIRFVNSVIERAFLERASDIHLEPQEGEMVVRMRIDGVLRTILTVPKELQASVISRLKIMGGMNTSERRVPQDGRANIRLKKQDIDLRINTLPTIHGETVMMGSAYFMKQSKVTLPRDLKLKTGVFLSVDGQLIAIFAIKYQASRNVDWALRAVRRNRIQPVLAVREGNVTPGLLKRKFSFDVKPVYPDVSTRLALSELTEQRGEPNAVIYRTPLDEQGEPGRREVFRRFQPGEGSLTGGDRRGGMLLERNV